MHLRHFVVALAGAVLALGCGSTTPTPTNDDGGTPARLSQAGESCARSADCADALVCISQQCVVAGTTSPPPRQSARGETCAVSADCETGLVCWGVLDPLSPYTFSGRCDYENFGITPTGKTCSGECATAADCLELPLPAQAGPPLYRTCQDLAKALNTVSCSETSASQRECFLYATYCSSGANPWACTEGRCSYTATCTASKSGEVVHGCPLYTRSGVALANTTCNASTLKCEASAPSGCKADTDCTDKVVADDAADTCSNGECVCHIASGGCYRRCRNDLECAYGYVCGSSQYCVAGNACETDAFCAKKLGRTGAKCVTGACKLPCTVDLECSPSGLFSSSAPFLGQVCHAGYCEDIGCSSNTECSATSSGKTVHMFCQTPPAATTTAAPVSAITN